MTSEDVSAALREKFGNRILDTARFRDEDTAVVDPDTILDILGYLRDEKSFNHLSDVTAIDWLGRDPRFDVVYQLFSFSDHVWFRVKVPVNENQGLPTAVHLFPGANWAEREVYDLFGIVFDGHPGLHRILMPEGWVGYPLRKDYPMSQITLPRSGATKVPE